VDQGWKECLRLSAWFWTQSWTAEVSSFAFALMSLMGLVLVLSRHQAKPLPERPQLITINPIVLLFASFMRVGIGVVLAEGTLESIICWTPLAKFNTVAVASSTRCYHRTHCAFPSSRCVCKLWCRKG
jgi:hypothetical protein